MRMEGSDYSRVGPADEESPPNDDLTHKPDEQSWLASHRYSIYLFLMSVLLYYLLVSCSSLRSQTERERQQLQDYYEQVSLSKSKKAMLVERMRENEEIVVRYWNRSAQEGRRSSESSDYLYLMAKQKHFMEKVEFMKKMVESQDFFKGDPKKRVSYLLAMNNFKMVYEDIRIKREVKQLLQTQYDRLSKLHDFSLPEQPFCIVVPTLNNGQGFRYDYNMQSIINQNYTNYKIVVIDDASTDSNFELIQQFVEQNPIPQPVYLIKNKHRLSALPNIYNAATHYCDSQDILALVDGDDQLLGVNVLKVFNSVYTLQKLEVVYGNYIIHNRRDGYVSRGYSSPYSPEEKKYMKYRDESTRMFPLRTFKVATFRNIPLPDLQDDFGHFFTSAYDQTICPQLLELSCGRNQYIDEYSYFVNKGLGNNDMEVDPDLNYRIMHNVRYRKEKHQCPP